MKAPLIFVCSVFGMLATTGLSALVLPQSTEDVARTLFGLLFICVGGYLMAVPKRARAAMAAGQIADYFRKGVEQTPTVMFRAFGGFWFYIGSISILTGGPRLWRAIAAALSG